MAKKKKIPEATIKLNHYHDENISTRAYHVLTKEQTDILEATKAKFFFKSTLLVDGPLLPIPERQYKIAATPNAKKQLKQNLKSFKWVGREPEQQLSVLHAALIDTGAIAIEESLETFCGAFSGKGLDEQPQMIWLLKDVELAYLFENLIQNGLITIGTEYNSIVRDSQIFIDKHGNSFNNLRGAKQSYLRNKPPHKPKRHLLIDKVINSIPINPKQP